MDEDDDEDEDEDDEDEDEDEDEGEDEDEDEDEDEGEGGDEDEEEDEEEEEEVCFQAEYQSVVAIKLRYGTGQLGHCCAHQMADKGYIDNSVRRTPQAKNLRISNPIYISRAGGCWWVAGLTSCMSAA